MSDSLPPRPTHQYTEEDWNQIRSHFMGSMLVDVHLHKLAQNAGTSWPLKDAEETPAKYIEYEFEELAALPTLTSNQGSRVNLLLDILKETLAFDDPFGDMVSDGPAPETKTQNPLQFLSRNEIPEDFPFAFIRLSPETKSLCDTEDVQNLADCVRFFQRMAQTVLLSGEVRHFLNSLADSDEAGIAHYLPFRPGSRGLHLAEAIAQSVQSLPESELHALQKLYFAKKSLSQQEIEQAEQIDTNLQREARSLHDLFPEETVRLKQTIEQEGSAQRFFMILNSPETEKVAVALSEKIFPPPQLVAESKSLFGKLSGMFRKK